MSCSGDVSSSESLWSCGGDSVRSENECSENSDRSAASHHSSSRKDDGPQLRSAFDSGSGWSGRSRGSRRSLRCLGDDITQSSCSEKSQKSSYASTVSSGCGDGPLDRNMAGMDVGVEADCLNLETEEVEKAVGEFGFKILEIERKKPQAPSVVALKDSIKYEFRLRLPDAELGNLRTLAEGKKSGLHVAKHLYSASLQIEMYVREIPVMSLGQYLGDLAPSMVSEDLARNIANQLIESLLFFERNDMIHQNLKLSTVLISGRPFILKLSGFENLLKISDSDASTRISRKDCLDHWGHKYISPEISSETGATATQLAEDGGGGLILTKIDPYRLGVMIYRIVMGRYHLDSLHPGIHMSQKIWTNDFKDVSAKFQKMIRGAMLVSPPTRLSLDQIKYTAWMKEGDTVHKIPF